MAQTGVAARQRGIPVRIGPERAADELEELIAGQPAENVDFYGPRMRDRDEVDRSFCPVPARTHLVDSALPQRDVEPVHAWRRCRVDGASVRL